MTPILVTPTWRGNSFLKSLLKSFEIENPYFVFPKTNLYMLSCIKLQKDKKNQMNSKNILQCVVFSKVKFMYSEQVTKFWRSQPII